MTEPESPEVNGAQPPAPRKLSLKARLLLGLAGVAYAPFALWCIAALWIDGPGNRILAALCCLLFLAAVALILVKVRPLLRLLPAACVPVMLVLLWWLTISPSNNRQWLRDVSRLPVATGSTGVVTISNIRNFTYRSESDFDENWETRTYDLDQVRGMDLFMSYWSGDRIAHTIASWEFADGSHLAISIETRKEVGETYSALLGFFRQYEIYYVVADERDVVGLRAAKRGEQVYLYRMKHPPEVARQMLSDYLAEINKLSAHPEWYNAATSNCTTTIRHHAKAIGAAQAWDRRILINGRLDEMGYERGVIDTSLPFDELRRKSNITEAARAAIGDPQFSALIRESLPGAREGIR